MEVDALVADSVVVAEGKLYIQGGGWNVIWTQSTPARHPRIGIGALIHVPFTATNQMHEFSIRIVDEDETALPLAAAPPQGVTPDGKVTELKGQFNMGRPPFLTPGDEQVIPLAVNLDGLEFPKPAMYHAVIAIDGTDLKRLPIRVIIINPQASMTPQ